MVQEILVVGPLQCNCLILGCEKTKEAVIVDPGDEASRILERVDELGLKPKLILHTHAHFDHIGGTAAVRAQCNAPTCVHAGDELLFKNLPLQGKMFGMQFGEAPPVEHFLEDEEVLQFGEYQIKVLHTPGHSPGSVCFHVQGSEERILSGDTLFYQSIGRSDLWGGDGGELLRSIRERLFTLKEDLPVFPGHGPSTTLLNEKRTNPFLV